MTVRFGLRLKLPLGLFPGAGVFVGRINEKGYGDIEYAVGVLRAALVFAGRSDWADLLVFERR